MYVEWVLGAGGEVRMEINRVFLKKQVYLQKPGYLKRNVSFLKKLGLLEQMG
jgi:hypothetical protein